eukprot:3694842-Prymnesium_polylepis.1
MFDDITRKEIAIIRRAGTTLGNTTGNYVPQVNFIVSQMRTKARFAHYRNDKKSGRDAPRDDWWNLKPGTVIDSGITEAGLDNFYLVSAKALQGTARAPHYHVLENDSQFSLDELQVRAARARPSAQRRCAVRREPRAWLERVTPCWLRVACSRAGALCAPCTVCALHRVCPAPCVPCTMRALHRAFPAPCVPCTVCALH